VQQDQAIVSWVVRTHPFTHSTSENFNLEFNAQNNEMVRSVTPNGKFVVLTSLDELDN
jgi:hypothetical protein